jgi:hypothetical protein
MPVALRASGGSWQGAISPVRNLPVSHSIIPTMMPSDRSTLIPVRTTRDMLGFSTASPIMESSAAPPTGRPMPARRRGAI